MSSFLVMSKDDTAVLRAKRAKQSMEVKEAKYYHLYDCCVIYRRFCLYMWVGTRIVQFTRDVATSLCLPLIKWNSYINSTETLKDAVAGEYETITKDISSLHRSFPSYDTSPGMFGKVQDKALYIYRHKHHLTYSSSSFTQLIGLLKMEDLCEYKKFLHPCGNTKACHASLYPYLFADEQCKFMFTALKEKGDITPKEHKSMEDQLKKIQSELAEYVKQSSSGSASAGCYHENDWTHRLHLCLQFNNIDSELTARLPNYDVKKSWLKRLPQEINDSSLLFQGAPDLDLIVKTNKSEGVINTPHERDTGTTDEDLPSSQGSGRIQIAHQMTQLEPYTEGSFLYDKTGELVAAVHNSLACRAFRKYSKGETVDSLTGHGLYVHRSVGIFHMEVTLSHEGMKQI